MREEEIKFLSLFFVFPFLLFISIFIFSKIRFCWKFCSLQLFLVLRCVSWVLHLFSCVLWMIVYESCSKPLEMFYCHEFMFNWHGISRGKSCFLVYMKEVRSAENRTPRVCLNSEFSGCNTDVFAFLWYF